jgi:glycogen operon protein
MLENGGETYRNYSGCGNTLNCNHPVVRDFIRDCLYYWVLNMHVDGFRFDLASILGRDQQGNLIPNPPLVERIAEDPILRDTKIIAEAWDAAGAYQVGSFPGGRWAEWNGRFRDDVRRFWRSEPGLVGALATRLAGSSDLYLRDGRAPFHSVNFVTCHDGFTLQDLVSYNHKHNEANGEDNGDGENYNSSANYGIEGPTDDPAINDIRRRQMKNLLATLLLSQGVPMVLGGDEFGRTQRGNNNAYCQDNEISWYNWQFIERNAELFRFFRELTAFRRRHPALWREHFFDGEKSPRNQFPDIRWYDNYGKEPDWRGLRPTLGCFINGCRMEIVADKDDNDFYMMFNSGAHDRMFVVPVPPSLKSWRVAIDTGRRSPQDILLPGEELALDSQTLYRVKAHSAVVLLSF